MLALKRRAGFTLAELLIVITLLAIVGGAIHDGLRRQQRLFRSIAAMIAARSDVRDAAEVLFADLISASPLDTLRVATDSAVEFMSAAGTSVSCDSNPGFTLRLPPEDLASGLRLTSLPTVPDTSDLVLIFNDDSAATSGVPRWDAHAVAAVSSQPAATACPSVTGFTSAADAAAAARTITLRTAASSAVRAGAPLRIVRRSRYSLYRSSDSRWYLGHRRCSPLGPSTCETVQPVSGAYAPYSGAGGSGVSLRYFGVGGDPLGSWDAKSRAALIEITVRARASPLFAPGRMPSAAYTDSATVSVALRNRD